MNRPKPIVEVIDDETAERYRNMTFGQKLAIVNDLFRAHRENIKARLKVSYPDWSDKQLEWLSREKY